VGSFFRKPLGLFVTIAVVGLIVIVAAMNAFGGTSGGSPPGRVPLTPAQFDHAELHVCLSLRSQLRWFVKRQQPGNLREVESWSGRLTAMTERLTAELNGVIPPPSSAAAYHRFLRKINTLDDAVRRLDHLVQTHQWRKVVLLARTRWWKRIFGPPGKIAHMNMSCRPVSKLLN
jgi:hypothetical protein